MTRDCPGMLRSVRGTWFAAVVLFSWPPMFASALWARSGTAVFALNVTAMLGAALGTWLHARWRKESLVAAEWRLPSPKSLVAIFVGCAIVWWLPLAVDLATGHRPVSDLDLPSSSALAILGAIAYLALAPIAGFGEELAWRGYLLPRLLPGGSRKAIAIVGVVWGLWHGPLVVIATARHAEPGSPGWLAGLGTLCLTTALTIPLSAVFAWVWRRTRSVFAIAFLHGEYDATRDLATALVKGKLGVLALVPLAVVVIAGIVVLIRGLPEPER